MKWIVVVFVNFLPEIGQWELYDYRKEAFSSKAACEEFITTNRQEFINEANMAYQRNDDDYLIACPRLDKFNANITPDEFDKNINV